MALNTDRWDTTGDVIQSGGQLQLALTAASGLVQADNKFNQGGRPDITAETSDFPLSWADVDLDSVSPSALIQQYQSFSSTEIIGFRADSGLPQEFFVEIGGSDIYTEAASGNQSSVTTDRKREDFKFTDTYTGSGQNSGTVDLGVWPARFSELFTNGSASINSNKLDLVVDSGNPELFGYINEIELSGAFEVTVYLEFTNFLANNTVSQSANFRCHRADTDGFLCQIQINKINADSNSEWSILKESLSGETSVATDIAVDNATLKLRREEGSDKIQMTYNSVAFDTVREETYSGTVKIAFIGASRWTGGNVEITFDPITIDNEQFNKRPVFYKDGSVVAAYNDNNAPIDEISLNLNSVNAVSYTAYWNSFGFNVPTGNRYSTAPP